MKQGWEIKKLGEVSEILNGGTPDTKEPKFWNGENLWITPKDMGKMESIYVEDTSRKITYEGLKNSSAKILPINSIILSSRAPIGHLAINRKPISTNQGCKGLIPNKGVSTLYLYYFLSKSVDLLNSLGSGATFKELSSTKLGAIKMPLPPLSEQQRIVAILDETFAAIDKAKANAEQNLKNTKELFESYLQGVFESKGEGWEEKKLADLCTKISDGVHKKPTYVSAGIPFIKINNLTEGPAISFNKVSYITKEDHLEYCKRTKPERGDILITKDGTIGVVRVIETDIEFSIFVSVALIKPKLKEMTPFLKYVLISPIIQNQIKPKGAALKHLYLTDLRRMTIPFPSLKEQKFIVKKLDALSVETNKLESIYQKKIIDLEDLKKSVLQKAFSGELKSIKEVAI